MLGLDGAGKTTILYALKLGTAINTIPTIGFNVEELKYKTISFLVWDVGGQEKLRSLWSHYFEKCVGLIFVVDSSDTEHIGLAAVELNRIVAHDNMKNCVVLVLANKRDVATMSVESISTALRLNEMKRNWAVFPVCAIKDDANSLAAAMEWLIDNIDDVANPKKVIKMGFGKPKAKSAEN
jgi:small GTP-binding protein